MSIESALSIFSVLLDDFRTFMPGIKVFGAQAEMRCCVTMCMSAIRALASDVWSAKMAAASDHTNLHFLGTMIAQ
jgi:hypothetical protein